MLKTIRKYISQHKLLSPHATQLVALSGGADSVCLLLALKQLGYDVHAVHCNFRLRGDESQRDENFCVALCKGQNIPLHRTHFDTRAYAELHHVSIEMAARNLRYDYFEQLRQAIRAENIVVAHHRDDNVETVLLNLLRGTGITGLCGIRPRNSNIVRPLLCVTRRQIEQWLAQQGQTYITDSTNLVPDVKRNRLRLQVIPLLKQINPALDDSIQQTIDNLTEAETVLDDAIQKSIGQVTEKNTDTPQATAQNHTGTPQPVTQDLTIISISELKKQVSPEQVLYAILSDKGFNGKQIREISNAVDAPVGKMWQSATHTLTKDRGTLLLGLTPPQHSDNPTVLTVPMAPIVITGNNRKITIETCPADKLDLRHSPVSITVQADALRFPITLRYAQPGDAFRPYGMKGRKLVSDYLTDRKRNYFQRAAQLVLVDANGNIIWLVGERIADQVAVKDHNAKMYTIKLEGK